MQEFYKEQQVLLTGATGFLGKIILHQLLKTEVRRVFLIVRSRKDQLCYSRIQALFAKEPFQRPVDPRIEVMEGDITMPNLGLSVENEEYLRKRVTIFINNAASVSFENTLKSAVEHNVISTLETLLLAKSWRFLKCFVYVSTAFSNCTMPIVEEKVYRHTFVSLENLLRAYDMNPEALLKWNLRGHPNTYTFSKQHAEALVASSGLPHVIVRPPIIVGSLEDPSCGWVDNFNGYNCLILLSERGRNPPLLMKRRNIVALAPVDLCANVILGAAWRRSFRPENTVYNCTCSRTAPKISVMVDTLRDVLKSQKSNRHLRTASNKLSLFIVFTLLFFIPALIVQLYNVVTGNPDRPLSKAMRARTRCAMMEYFLTKEIVFEYKNVRELSAELPPREKDVFRMEISEINWQLFLSKTALGLLRYAEVVRDKKKQKNGQAVEDATTKL